jgi:hypothetical protein
VCSIVVWFASTYTTQNPTSSWQQSFCNGM